MAELDVVVLAPRPHRLDHAEQDAAAAVRGQAGRLVEREVVLVLEDDRRAQPVQHVVGRPHRRAVVGPAHRRHADLVALGQAPVGLGAAAVHAHLARADDPVDGRARHPGQDPEQEVVEALAVLVAGDRNLADGLALAGGRWAFCRGMCHNARAFGRACKPP